MNSHVFDGMVTNVEVLKNPDILVAGVNSYETVAM